MTSEFDPHAGPSPQVRRRTMFWVWAERSSRREYWIHLALLCAIGLALDAPPAIGMGLGVVMLLVQVRRVHDFGRSAWWAVAAWLAPMAALPAYFVAGENGALLLALPIEIAGIIWVGAIPGEMHENRFGPPPPFGLKRLLTGR
jgi:uncharacterized membrane protein YhaH (DUF805 family)